MNFLSYNETNPTRRPLLFAVTGIAVTAALASYGATTNKTPNSSQSPLPTRSESLTRELTLLMPKRYTESEAWAIDFSKQPDGPLRDQIWHVDVNPDTPIWNDEKQMYTNNPRNVRIENGVLVIEAHRQQSPQSYPNDPNHTQYSWTSARIDSRGNGESAEVASGFSFEYGELTVRTKMPKGRGAWAAVPWLLSSNQKNTAALGNSVDWSNPSMYKLDGEIDGAEYYGDKPGLVEATIHTFNTATESTIAVPDADVAFHNYGIRITNDAVVWLFDGNEYFRVDKPSDNPADWPVGNGNKFYFILNLAMGGTGGGEIDPLLDSARVEVQSIYFKPN